MTESPYPKADSQNIDGFQLAEAVDQASEIDNLRSLLIARNDVLVLEEYFAAHGTDSLHDVRSVTKSFMATLIGIAIDKGFIQNVNLTIADFFDEVIVDLDVDKGKITIHQLLTMSCGLEWEEIGSYSEFNTWISSPNQIDYILSKQWQSTPGTMFNYSDGAAHLVSVILHEAIGANALSFANEHLFEPLGIGERFWSIDKQGYNYGGVALRITPRDMIKLGQLYLQNGMYAGKRIVSEQWIQTTTESHISTNNAVPYGSDYGYFWWIGIAHQHDYYFANGYGGQFIVVVPELNLVVVATNKWQSIGGRDAAGQQWYETLSIIMETILTAVN